MPLYEAECPEHGRFEVSRRFSDANDIKCTCGRKARIVPSKFNFTFGWRLTEASHERFHKDEVERDV